MVRSYLRVAFIRAAQQTCRAVIARSWAELLKNVTVASLVIGLLYIGVEQVDPLNDVYDDQLLVAQALLVATLIAASGWFAVNLLFVAPYQLWREQKERADQAEAASVAAGETPQQRATRLYQEELAREEAAVKAKAAMMHKRLATRNWSMTHADTHLAAMWDAEQKGQIYDELHRSTFEPSRSTRRARAAEAKKVEEDRAAQLYQEELAREQASIRAKAEMMRERLEQRRHRISGAPDTQMAAWWDAEQRGQVYDDVHAFTLQPLPSTSRGKGPA